MDCAFVRPDLFRVGGETTILLEERGGARGCALGRS